MVVLSIVLAGLAGFVFGGVWYTVLAKPWMEASGVAVDETGKPVNRADPVPYITSIVGSIAVAAMMRHIFSMSGIDSFGKALVAGLGIGLVLVTPWIATFNAFGGRPVQLTLINGGYATFGCTVIGIVLSLF